MAEPISSTRLSQMPPLSSTLETADFGPSQDLLFSSTPFLLAPGTVELVKRCGSVLSRFWRTADLVERRSSRGSLPSWIASLVRKGISSPDSETPGPVRLYQASFRIIGNDPSLCLSLKDWQVRCDGIGLAAWLQRTVAEAGAELIGGPKGIWDGLEAVTAEGTVLTFSGNDTRASAEEAWISRQLGPRVLCQTIEGDGPLLLENRLWMALLCSAPLQEVWARELRSSNLHFLRKLLPMSWTVDPAPLPHQAVIPRLGVRSFAEAAPSAFSDLVLRSVLWKPGQAIVVRSETTDQEWTGAMERALASFETAPWLLQERTPHPTGLPSCQVGMDARSGLEATAAEEPELTAFYFERNNEVTTGGILIRLKGGKASPPEGANSKTDEGESGEKFSLLAPCGVAGPGLRDRRTELNLR